MSPGNFAKQQNGNQTCVLFVILAAWCFHLSAGFAFNINKQLHATNTAEKLNEYSKITGDKKLKFRRCYDTAAP